MSNPSSHSDGFDRSRRFRGNYQAEEKAGILSLHLLEGVPVSDVCEHHEINPTLFSRWPKDLFE